MHYMVVIAVRNMWDTYKYMQNLPCWTFGSISVFKQIIKLKLRGNTVQAQEKIGILSGQASSLAALCF